jgi:Flp pilus assembly protein TadB
MVVPLILYAQLLFGILFVIRTLQIFRERALLSTSSVTKTGITFVCACVNCCFFCARMPFLCTGLTTGCVLLTPFTLILLEKREIFRLRSEIPLFLDRWILNLRLGSALSTAREAALREHSDSLRALLQPLFTAQSRCGKGHVLLPKHTLDELERIQNEPHAALARLENLRRWLRKNSEFRRKSGQAVRQTAIQSATMVFLLFALIIFTVHRYGWRQSGDLILAALSLTMIGVLCMCLLARKSRWKI